MKRYRFFPTRQLGCVSLSSPSSSLPFPPACLPRGFETNTATKQGRRKAEDRFGGLQTGRPLPPLSFIHSGFQCYGKRRARSFFWWLWGQRDDNRKEEEEEEEETGGEGSKQWGKEGRELHNWKSSLDPLAVSSSSAMIQHTRSPVVAIKVRVNNGGREGGK